MINYRCTLCGNTLKVTRFRRNKYRLWACMKCQFASIYPRPSNDEISKYYKTAYSEGNYNKVLEIGHQVKEYKFARLIKQIQKNMKVKDFSQISILDVGCSDGIFLELVKRKGALDFLGVEISDEATRNAIALLGKENVFIGKVEEYAKTTTRKYSLITMFDLIEHVADINGIMEAINQLIENNGCIVITTPNWHSFYAFILGFRWPYFIPPEHLSFFSPQTIEYFGKKYGYKVLLIGKAIKYVSLRYFVEVANYLSPSLAKIPATAIRFIPMSLQDMAFPVYLGEIFTVLQKAK